MPMPSRSINKLLERMRANPAGDWTIQDVATICRAEGLLCMSPRGGGSHRKVTHPQVPDILTVPSRRPIKPIYIRKLVALVDAVRRL
jgi:predicted RNA binding protein YcfA (HicA-like mRNA interferase family)